MSEIWRDVAATYDRSFGTLCSLTLPHLLAALGPAAGSDDDTGNTSNIGNTSDGVLDLGCGSGLVTAGLLAAGHRVVAADPDPHMRALAAYRTGLAVQDLRLPDLSLPDASVSRVVANFVLNHVEDPALAMAGIARVLPPGGRLVATFWSATPAPHAAVWNEVLDDIGGVRPPLPRLAPDKDFERTPDGVAALARAAGLEASCEPVLLPWRVAVDDLVAGFREIATFGVLWQAQSTDVRTRLEREFRRRVAPLPRQSDRDPPTLAFEVEALVLSATAAP